MFSRLFSGRIGRLRCLAFLVASWITGYALTYVGDILSEASEPWPDVPGEGSGWLFLAGLLSYLAALVIPLLVYFSAIIRRSHDLDSSAWNALWIFVPIAGWLYLLILIARPGDLDTNRYGPGQIASTSS